MALPTAPFLLSRVVFVRITREGEYVYHSLQSWHDVAHPKQCQKILHPSVCDTLGTEILLVASHSVLPKTDRRITINHNTWIVEAYMLPLTRCEVEEARDDR